MLIMHRFSGQYCFLPEFETHRDKNTLPGVMQDSELSPEEHNDTFSSN